ncbi:MAG TPA: hypothetical protein VGZ32_21700 [Actinocrinis sp.]|jgi:hypothetical protein|nr:hypothetical protein [Actinocrinis sp.]HEV3172976.1 hypothetical protein [Actinocrinis sp.]
MSDAERHHRYLPFEDLVLADRPGRGDRDFVRALIERGLILEDGV